MDGWMDVMHLVMHGCNVWIQCMGAVNGYRQSGEAVGVEGIFNWGMVCWRRIHGEPRCRCRGVLP